MRAKRVIEADTNQKRVQFFAFFIAVGFSVFFCIFWGVSNLFDSGMVYKVELESKINPNEATAVSLMRLPGIGIGRAEAIIAYREYLKSSEQGGVVFERAEDLQKVKGVGPKTVDSIGEWLRFK